MILTENCSQTLTVLIESQYEDWSFIYDIVKTVDINIRANPHSHPIPYGTKITDHIEREMDTIKIDGVIGCFRCGGFSPNPTFVIPTLKRLSERMIYNKDSFVLLTSNHWQSRFSILTDVQVRESQKGVQTKRITTTWVGANLTGTIRDPNFKRGGIVY